MISKDTPASDDAMTIRAYLAAAALQGIIANPNWNDFALKVAGVKEDQVQYAAGLIAVRYADATIAALNKTE